MVTQSYLAWLEICSNSRKEHIVLPLYYSSKDKECKTSKRWDITYQPFTTIYHRFYSCDDLILLFLFQFHVILLLHY